MAGSSWFGSGGRSKGLGGQLVRTGARGILRKDGGGHRRKGQSIGWRVNLVGNETSGPTAEEEERLESERRWRKRLMEYYQSARLPVLTYEMLVVPMRLAYVAITLRGPAFIVLDIATDAFELTTTWIKRHNQGADVAAAESPHAGTASVTLGGMSWRRIVTDLASIVALHTGRALFIYRDIPWLWYSAQIIRMARVRDLSTYMAQIGDDLGTNPLFLAVFKFSLVMFAVPHWIGCAWEIANPGAVAPGWASQFFQITDAADFDQRNAPEWGNYLVATFMGWSSMAAIGFGDIIFTTLADLFVATVATLISIVFYAYVLGTLFHYLVRTDENTAHFKELLKAVVRFTARSGLPPALSAKVRDYFAFQHRKQAAGAVSVFNQLPLALKVRVASAQYYRHVQHAWVLRGCNAQFLSQIVIALTERFVMPLEVLFNKGDGSRELLFCTSGQLAVRNGDVHVKTIAPRVAIDGQTVGEVVGDVAFFLNMQQPYTVLATADGDVTLLVLNGAAYDEIVLLYPEQADVIRHNINRQFGLNARGGEVGAKQGAPAAGAPTAAAAAAPGAKKAAAAADGAAAAAPVATAAAADGSDEQEEFELLRALIREKVTARTEETLTQTMYAAGRDDVEAVTALSSQGLEVDEPNYDGRTTLHVAAAEGNKNVVELLCELGADVHMRDRLGRTPFAEAVVHRHDDVATLLLARGATLELSNPASLLFAAATVGDTQRISSLLSFGIAIDSQNHDLRTALHHASSIGQIRVVEYLISSLADVNAKDRRGWTALDDAIHTEQRIVMQMLKRAGSLASATVLQRAMSLAAANADVDKLRFLADAGASINAVDADGRTPLHLAACSGSISSAQFLLFANADVHALDRRGSTPLIDALTNSNDTAALLINYTSVRVPDRLRADTQLCAIFDGAVAQDMEPINDKLQFRAQLRKQLHAELETKQRELGEAFNALDGKLKQLALVHGSLYGSFDEKHDAWAVAYSEAQLDDSDSEHSQDLDFLDEQLELVGDGDDGDDDGGRRGGGGGGGGGGAAIVRRPSMAAPTAAPTAALASSFSARRASAAPNTARRTLATPAQPGAAVDAATTFISLVLKLPKAERGLVALRTLFERLLPTRLHERLAAPARRDAEHAALLELLTAELLVGIDDADAIALQIYAEFAKLLGVAPPAGASAEAGTLKGSRRVSRAVVEDPPEPTAALAPAPQAAAAPARGAGLRPGTADRIAALQTDLFRKGSLRLPAEDDRNGGGGGGGGRLLASERSSAGQDLVLAPSRAVPVPARDAGRPPAHEQPPAPLQRVPLPSFGGGGGGASLALPRAFPPPALALPPDSVRAERQERARELAAHLPLFLSEMGYVALLCSPLLVAHLAARDSQPASAKLEGARARSNALFDSAVDLASAQPGATTVIGLGGMGALRVSELGAPRLTRDDQALASGRASRASRCSVESLSSMLGGLAERPVVAGRQRSDRVSNAGRADGDGADEPPTGMPGSLLGSSLQAALLTPTTRAKRFAWPAGITPKAPGGFLASSKLKGAGRAVRISRGDFVAGAADATPLASELNALDWRIAIVHTATVLESLFTVFDRAGRGKVRASDVRALQAELGDIGGSDIQTLLGFLIEAAGVLAPVATGAPAAPRSLALPYLQQQSMRPFLEKSDAPGRAAGRAAPFVDHHADKSGRSAHSEGSTRSGRSSRSGAAAIARIDTSTLRMKSLSKVAFFMGSLSWILSSHEEERNDSAALALERRDSEMETGSVAAQRAEIATGLHAALSAPSACRALADAIGERIASRRLKAAELADASHLLSLTVHATAVPIGVVGTDLVAWCTAHLHIDLLPKPMHVDATAAESAPAADGAATDDDAAGPFGLPGKVPALGLSGRKGSGKRPGGSLASGADAKAAPVLKPVTWAEVQEALAARAAALGAERDASAAEASAKAPRFAPVVRVRAALRGWLTSLITPRVDAADGGEADAAADVAAEVRSTSERPWFVIDHRSPLALYVHALFCVASLWDLMVIPVQLCFFYELSLIGWIDDLNYAVDAVYWLRMASMLLTSYVNHKSVVVYTPRLIRTHYLTSAFTLDAIAFFPQNYLARGLGASAFASYALRLFRLIALRYPYRWYRDWEKSRADVSLTVGIVQHLLILGVICHICAGIWNVLAYSPNASLPQPLTWGSVYEGFMDGVGAPSYRELSGEAQILRKWLVAYYFMVTTLTNFGANQLPLNYGETIWLILMMLLYFTVYSWAVGQISALVMKQDDEIVSKRGQLKLVRGYLAHIRVARDLDAEIAQLFQTRLKDASTSAVRDEAIESAIPISMHIEVSRFTRRGIVSACALFRGCSDSFVDRLASLVRDRACEPDLLLYRKGEVCAELFIVEAGAVRTYDDPELEGSEPLNVQVMIAGETIGEAALVFGIKHFNNARTEVDAETTLLTLSAEDFKLLMRMFPNQEDTLMDNAMSQWEGVAMSARSGKSGRSGRSGRSGNSRSSTGSGGSKGSSTNKTRSSRSKQRKALFGLEGLLGSAASSAKETTAAKEEARIETIIETAREQRGNLLTVRLCSACAAGDLVRIQRLLATSQLDVNRGDYDRRTPLHLAASRGHIKAVHLLLASHADANARDRAERTPLSEAQTSRNGEMLRLLLRFGAEMQTSGMADLLCAAAARADGLEELSFLIKGGTDPSIATEFDARTALHVAASCGHLPQVRLLIEVPASLNAVDLHDSTPLHDAFVHGHDDCSQLLLAAGAHMGRFDAARALCDAAGQNDVELIRRILAHGCDVNAENYDGRTALHVAAASHQLAAATLLLSVKGLVFNHEDRYGETPLDDAQRNPSELRSVVVSLIEAFGGRLGSHKLRPSAERAAAEQHKAMKDLAHVELLRTLLLKAKRCVLWVVGQLAAAKQLYIATHEALRLEMSKGMVLDFERPDYLVSVVEFAIGHRARQQFVTSFMRPLIELWQGQSDQYGSLKLELYKRVELLAEQQADVTVALQSLSETVFRSKEQAERERLKAEVEEGATKGRITNRNSKK